MTAVALMFALGAGCASRRETASQPAYSADGAVKGELVDVPAEGRYQAAVGVVYTGGLPLRGNAMPAYPPALLDRRLPEVQVLARVVVDNAGGVQDATILEAPGADSAFTDAVLVTVRQWTFEPLRRRSGGVVESLPFSQTYRFTFRQVDGRAVVESAGAR